MIKFRTRSVVPYAVLLISLGTPAYGAAPTVKGGEYSLGPVAQASAQRGIKSCIKRVDQVSSFIAQGRQMGVFLFNSTNNADKKIYSTSMEIDNGDKSVYATSTYAPTGRDGCDGLYEEVNWWPGSCANVSSKVFPQFQAKGKLLKNIDVLDGGQSTRVFLMPAGGGCVSIKKEVIY